MYSFCISGSHRKLVTIFKSTLKSLSQVLFREKCLSGSQCRAGSSVSLALQRVRTATATATAAIRTSETTAAASTTTTTTTTTTAAVTTTTAATAATAAVSLSSVHLCL